VITGIYNNIFLYNLTIVKFKYLVFPIKNMKRSLVFGIIIVLLSVSLVLAVQSDFVVVDVNPSNGHANVVIPSNAVEVAPGVFSLGSAKDVDGIEVEGYVFVHYKNKGDGVKPGSGGGSTGTTCYAFLANGAKWKNVENYSLNPLNNQGLSDNFILSNLDSDIGKWDSASGKDILGIGSLTNDTLVADSSSPDGNNEVYFSDVSDSGVIAYTTVWGVFSGPPKQRKLVEWDMVFDQNDFNWSTAGEAGEMDFENIATHELGHAVGMGHPSDSCVEETMYRFAGYGEIKKRDLNSGDITGIRKLYA